MRQKYFIDYALSLIIIDNLLIFIIKDHRNLTAQLDKNSIILKIKPDRFDFLETHEISISIFFGFRE
jgi:hypothetical protein